MKTKNPVLAGLLAATFVVAAACSKQEAKQAKNDVTTAAANVKEKVEDAIDVAVPVNGKDDPAAREKERFNEDWRNLESLRSAQAAAAAPAQAPPEVNVAFVQNAKETFRNMTPDAINKAPVSVPLKGDVSGPSVLKTQVYLDRANFSVGALDGRWGRNTAIALWWYQRSRGINAAEPGALDEATFRSLASVAGGAPALIEQTITADDVKGPFVTIPEDVYDKEKLDCLCYESKLEKLAERFHTTQEFLESLNPDVNFNTIDAGAKLWVPNVRPPRAASTPDIARVVVSIKGNTFNAFDASGRLIFHAPTTLGSKYDPSPNETAEVKKVVFDPHFHYQPTLFHEVPDSDPEANLNPGPNSPVGVVWIALSKPHFGIHGTSDPESIGYASSHGCVRLANWDAREVAQRIAPGAQIEFLDTRKSSASSQVASQ
ncbi:MAG TPA: L,D-transpeptidase family protein [Thermoanaerobaculia bacterium]|nr:L,D-transpeptidase family protein [Thermoanaerobaculia bacterium]